MAESFVGQVQEDLKSYLNTRYLVGRLRLVGGISRVLGLFVLMIVVILFAFALFTFGAVAAIIALAQCMPAWAACLLMGSVYLLLLVLAVVFRKPLFINPFVRRLSAVFFEVEGRQIEEERLRKEAEND